MRVLFLGLFLSLSPLAPPLARAQAPNPQSTVRAPQSDTLRLSVGEAIQRSLAVSPEVEAVAAQQDFAEARLRLARASRFLTEFTSTTAHAVAPGLDIPPGTAPTDPDELYLNPEVRNDWEALRPFNRIEVDLAQPIWTWGELGGNIDAARHGVGVEAAAVAEQARDVALRTGELYYGVLLADALFAVAQDAEGVIAQARGVIDDLVEANSPDVEESDLFQLEITEQELDARLVEVTERRQTARTALARQLFAPEGALVLPEPSVLEPLSFALDSLDAYFALALAENPLVAQAEAGLDARSALVRVARSDYYPKLFAVGEARYSLVTGRYRQPNPFVSDPFESQAVRAGVGTRLNLNFAQTRARVEQAEAERNQVAHQLVAARQLALFEVEDAYRNVRVAAAALDARTETFRITREWRQSELINFDLDLGSPQNLIEAVQASLLQEAQYYEAVQRYNVAVLRLLSAAGVLTGRAASGTLVEQ